MIKTISIFYDFPSNFRSGALPGHHTYVINEIDGKFEVRHFTQRQPEGEQIATGASTAAAAARIARHHFAKQ